MSKLIIQAMNVHVGGGASLLRSLLEAIPTDRSILALLDERMSVPEYLPDNLSIKRVSPSLWSRWKAEKWLGQNACNGDIVLCFGNLPPLRAIKSQVFLFLQNRFLIENVGLDAFPLKTRLRLWVERNWLSFLAHRVDYFAVQTPSMQRLLTLYLKVPESVVHVLPFSDIRDRPIPKLTKEYPDISTQFPVAVDFIYPASGDPHKNHKTLIDAWVILAKDGYFPSLYLTLDQSKYPELCFYLEAEISRHGLNVFNLGFLSHEEILKKYYIARALIFPSLIESFGLPLLEAREAGLAILAAELDYVRDILDPVQVFDPNSPLSIARAVRRFLCVPERELKPLNPNSFLQWVLETANERDG